jgi:hypothetical protein
VRPTRDECLRAANACVTKARVGCPLGVVCGLGRIYDLAYEHLHLCMDFVGDEYAPDAGWESIHWSLAAQSLMERAESTRAGSRKKKSCRT